MPLPYRIDWQDQARADIRQIDRATALRIFEAILHHARTGAGDVSPLHGALAGTFRLRIGDYRVFFTLEDGAMQIAAVLHRKEACR